MRGFHQCGFGLDKWMYLYRAVDSKGNTIDFFLRKIRKHKEILVINLHSLSNLFREMSRNNTSTFNCEFTGINFRVAGILSKKREGVLQSN